MMDRESIPRPFTSREMFHQPSPAGNAEIIAGMLSELDTETNSSATFGHLDELAIAFDCLAAFQSHGYRELRRPAYIGESWLRAEIRLRNGEAEEAVVHRLTSGDPTENDAEWEEVRDLPATVLGPLTEGGIS